MFFEVLKNKKDKMIKHLPVYTLFLMLVFCTFCKGQAQTDLPENNIKSETQNIVTSTGSSHNTLTDFKGKQDHK
jgi:hypothetical protein